MGRTSPQVADEAGDRIGDPAEVERRDGDGDDPYPGMSQATQRQRSARASSCGSQPVRVVPSPWRKTTSGPAGGPASRQATGSASWSITRRRYSFGPERLDPGLASPGMKPLIGLVGRRKRGSDIVGMPDALLGLDLDLYFADYARAVLAAGGVAMHVPIDADPSDVLDRCDGILLSGGADIGPEWYGRPSETDDYPPEPERDRFEMGLMDLAAERATPVLGICRGLQLANVHGGGTLHQDVPVHARYDVAPSSETHRVTFVPDSVLADLYGGSKTVNSLHHQTIDDVAPRYRVTARSDDGTVEGIEHLDLPVLGVQWHPEMMADRDADPIFRWLVAAAVPSRA